MEGVASTMLATLRDHHGMLGTILAQSAVCLQRALVHRFAEAPLKRSFAALPLREADDEPVSRPSPSDAERGDNQNEEKSRRLREMLAAKSPALLTRPQGDNASPSRGHSGWRETLEMARSVYGPGLTADAMMTDRHSRRHSYLRISLTERCNLRCTYCMPEDGVPLSPSADLLSTPEVARLVGIFAGAGVSKVRLTGGEPTLRKDLPDIVRLTREAGVREVGLTSNGIVLGRMLPALVDAGLNRLNVSLDTLREDRFETMTRRKGLSRVLESVERAVDLGMESVKLNVVVMRGSNEDELPAFVDLTRDRPINVRFIEYMPFDGNRWDFSKMMTYREMATDVERHAGRPLVRMGDPAGEVAKNFKLEGHEGTVSFVTSMTDHFCGDCNRVRVMADGALKVCLFGHSEVSLRNAMREGASDEDLRYVVAAALDRKHARHAGMFELARRSADGRAMVKIGG